MKCGLSFTILALLGLLASVAMEMDNNWPAAAFRCCRCWWPLCDGNRLVHTSSHRKSDRPCRNRRSNPTKTERWRCVMRSLVFIAPRSRLREAGRFVLYQGPLGWVAGRRQNAPVDSPESRERGSPPMGPGQPILPLRRAPVASVSYLEAFAYALATNSASFLRA
jgi:hypothetical protein